MKKTILFLLLMPFIAAGQNKKPITKPDTFTLSEGNVLTNDVDPNGDPMKVTKFNLKAITASLPAKIVKKDTGTFWLQLDGTFKVHLDSNFYGSVYFTYYVNDGKAGAGKTEKIVFTREKPAGYAIMVFDDTVYRLLYPKRKGCTDNPDPASKYLVEVSSDCYSDLGHVVADNGSYYILSQYGETAYTIKPFIYEWIVSNSCRQ